MKLIKLSTLLAAVLIAFSAVSDSFAQRQMGGGVGITVFKDRNFKGRSATYRNDVSNLDGTDFNDEISSIRVARGEYWEVCEHADFGGRCAVVSGEEADLRKNDWNDKISSLRRVRGGMPGWGGGGGGTSNDYIVLYTQPNYRGTPTNIPGGVAWLDKTARSVTIGRGTWQLCDGGNFTGRCETVSQSIPDLRSIGMNGRLASVRPVGWSMPDPTPNWSDWYIVLYSQNNYRGTVINYNSEQSNINRRVGSITIGKGVWEVCSGANFTGRCQTLNQSVPSYGIFGFGQNIRSLRPVIPQPR
ncbi:MAG: peptidase inhibitor family I36 protein [Acidobacteriota bacterium]|nr:MAG: peptidase inhibitor family I36 protein [Acidobacteriota bacterium]